MCDDGCWLLCVAAAGVHVRASGSGSAGRTHSRERGQQGHQLQSPQTAHSVRHHVVARRSAGTQRPKKGARRRSDDTNVIIHQ